jgi:hypothetical protein
MSRPRVSVVVVAAAIVAAMGAFGPTGAVAAPDHHGGGGGSKPGVAGAELTTSTRLADRRSLVIGDRFFEVGAEDGTYPAQGWHITGEMGGFWSTPIKLLDGLWFAVDGTWLKASSYTSGHGYARMDLGSTSGVSVKRVDVAPDGLRAGLVGLTFSAPSTRTVTLDVDAHSELLSAYPWGWTAPGQADYNLPDKGSYSNKSLVFREQGTPPVANATAHDWAAVVGTSMAPRSHQLGAAFRGPQGATICPATDPDAVCDDSIYGKGTGGRLTYSLTVPRSGKTVWFAVAGSDQGLAAAQRAQRAALARPDALLAAKIGSRAQVASQSAVDLPGDRLLQQSVEWSKQNLADSVQQANNLQLRVTHAGVDYPAPAGTLKEARWIGAGWPDYPWMFGTDGEYSNFAAVASGQFTAIENHLRSLRDVSDIINSRSGKVAHEIVPDGSVYFGANDDNGNTDETVKFPSAVALVWRWTGDNAFRDDMYDFTVRNLHYVYAHLDADGDGWPEGAGNVERTGMGPEKLDNAVYAIRGLLDLADMAASKGDTATQTWATDKATALKAAFEQTWWNGSDTKSYADSLNDPGNQQVFQRYWTGLTPVEAELPASGSTPAGPVASLDHAQETVAQHELPCYTGTYGLFHTGTGATTDAKGNPGPTCDSAVSSAPSDREVFTLGTSIAAVAEGAIGRMGTDELQRYTHMLATVQLDPNVYETPGAMPEIVPSPDFVANIDRPWTGRSMAIQAWGTYGVLWPVVHFELGVAPDLGHGRLSVVPQIPTGQDRVAGRNIRLGKGSVDVAANRSASSLTTTVRNGTRAALTIGAILPAGATAQSATLNGHPVPLHTTTTARGVAVTAAVPGGSRTATLVVTYTS